MTENALHLSIVTSVYDCSESLSELVARLKTTLTNNITEFFEIILVDDASKDSAWEVIQGLACDDDRIKGIKLSRNFGQHYAITAGLDFALGDWVIVMDCDLQDRPEEIVKLYRKALEGFDIVVGLRKNRQDSYMKKLLSRLFYKIFAYFTGEKINNRLCNFGIYSKKVINNIKKFKEQNRSFGLFALWVGFKRAEIDIEHSSRVYGRSSYTFFKMIRLALDSIVAHSNKLIYLSVKLGGIMSFGALLFSLWLVVRYLIWEIPVVGWTSLIVSIYFSTGLVIGTIGITGIYIAKIFDEVKGRPLYIIDKMTFK